MRLNDKTYTYSAPANLIDEGAWSHVAYTYNGSQVRLYHNGALVTTYSASGMLTAGPGVDLGIGNNPAAVGTGNPLNGKLDELRVYNRSLSDSEIAALISVQAYRQLPVTFTSFRAEPAFAGVELKWTVEDQRDNAGFAVERATGDEGVFTEVGFVAAHAHGDYHYTDYYAPQNATLYYRLRQVDHDGSEMYSSLVTVAPQQRQELSVYPNPASAYLRVNGSGPYAILDAYGRRVGSGMATDHQSIAVADLPAGTYTLHVNREAVRFVKQ
ncbi:hypothetical protein GGR26_001833 [Lewinella marina]|nr:hypothetical protein [Neolewinella marina]